MGKKSREIIRAKMDDVMSDLTKAYADEWLAHYQYWLTSRWIRRLDADTLRNILIEEMVIVALVWWKELLLLLLYVNYIFMILDLA